MDTHDVSVEVKSEKSEEKNAKSKSEESNPNFCNKFVNLLKRGFIKIYRKFIGRSKNEPKKRRRVNKIQTSKYTILSFIPKTLWYQFSRLCKQKIVVEI